MGCYVRLVPIVVPWCACPQMAAQSNQFVGSEPAARVANALEKKKCVPVCHTATAPDGSQAKWGFPHFAYLAGSGQSGS